MRKHKTIWVIHASLATMLGIGITTSVLAQQAPAPDQTSLRRLCFIATGASSSSRSFEDSMVETLRKAAGADPATDSEMQMREKVAALYRNPMALDRAVNRNGLFCNGDLHAGSILWLSLRSWNWPAVEVMIQGGADPNVVDSRTGRTLLDDVLLRTDNFTVHAERYVPPSMRDTQTYYYSHLRRYYEKLRELGSRHAWELSGSEKTARQKESDCLAKRPGDEPSAAATDYPGGLATKMSALTPATVPGATTVSVRQAACLVRDLGPDLLVIASMRDKLGIPGSRKYMAGSAKGNFDDEFQRNVAQVVQVLDAERKPVLVYCHSSSCFLSYNTALRFAAAKVPRIYWLRDGIRGWKDAGYPLAISDGFFINERTLDE